MIRKSTLKMTIARKRSASTRIMIPEKVTIRNFSEPVRTSLHFRSCRRQCVNAVINARVTKTADASVFAYHHFSLVFDTECKLAIYTAVNIDGLLRMNLKRDDDRWIFDPRLPREHQAGQELYSTNEFDLGHLVKGRPAWGKSEKQARLANDDTFHFTNCASTRAVQPRQ